MGEVLAPTGSDLLSSGRRRWRETPVWAAVGAATTTIACVLPVFLLGGLAVQISAEMRFSPAGLGLAVAIYFGVSALTSVPAGGLVERFGPAVVARAGIVLAAAGLLAIAAARSYPVLVMLLAASAAANGMGQLASNAALAQRVPAHRQGVSFGLKQTAIPAATLVAGASVPAVALTLGWRWAFVLAAALALASLALVPGDARPAEPGSPRRRPARNPGERATGALVVIGAAAMLAAGAASALGTFLVDASVERGLDPGLAGLTLTFGSAICLAARLAGGWLADHRSGGHLGMIAGLLGIGATGLSLLGLPGRPALIVGVVLGFGLGWAWPGLLNFAVVRLHPSAPAAATSITQTGVYAGASLGPLALGTVAAHTGYRTMWTVAAASMLVAAGAMLLGARRLTRAHTAATAP